MDCPRCKGPHRTYPAKLVVNGRAITQIEICPYYEKHEDITDDTVLALVEILDGRYFGEEGRQDSYAYFATELGLDHRLYRLVWLLKDSALFLGVVNCFRRD